MPGIHIRAIGHFDWTQEKVDNGLTVPGSYWLCHKDNIYKFIFRYHRMVRNTSEFAYGKELMKIIRRILKCQPRQGQQFGTQHLLVTYNHTSWTRQDKMFAMLKFKDRSNATAFSHAFVLTVKLSDSHDLDELNGETPTNSLNSNRSLDLQNQNVKSLDKVKSVDQKETKTYKYNDQPRTVDIPMNSSSKGLPENDRQCKYNSSGPSAKINSRSTQADSKSVDTNLDTSEKTFVVKVIGSSTNYTVTTTDRPLLEYSFEESIKYNRKRKRNKRFTRVSLKSSKLSDTHRICSNTSALMSDNVHNEKKDSDMSVELEQSTQLKEKSAVVQMTSIKGDKEQIVLLNDIDEPPLTDRFCSNKYTMDSQNNTINNGIKSSDNSLNGNVKAAPEAINLPYQYFIAKEIEDSKNKEMSSTELISEDNLQQSESAIRTTAANITSKERGASEEAADSFEKNTEMLNKVQRCKSRVAKESDKKLILDNRVSKSSDITDLVMEGLMFTIRQDQDSVAVIEQKTKLEIDEVLENSEKAETKEGEKCLRNSSLLGLENLITMIESSDKGDNQHKNQDILSRNSTLQLKSFAIEHSLNDINEDSKSDNTIPVEWKLYSNTTPSFCAKNANSLNAKPNLPNDEIVHEIEDTDDHIKLIFREDDEGPENQNEVAEKELQNKEEEEMLIVEEGQEEVEEIEEEEDIVPEALQEIIGSEILQSQSLTATRDLLMDDMDVDESMKQKAEIQTKQTAFDERHPSPDRVTTDRRPFNCRNEPSCNKSPISKHSDKPRVVSNQVITVDQMPLALQQVLKNKLMKQHITSNDTDNSKIDSNISIENSCGKENATSNTNLISESVTDDTSSQPKRRVSLRRENQNHAANGKCTNSVVSEEKPQNRTDACAVTKLEKKETKVLRSHACKSKRVASTKLQDITHDFYQDLIQLQKKYNSGDQRCLRQRRRSLNIVNGIRNSETRVEMLKFIQDITRGAKVVVHRLSTKSISNIIGKSSSLATCMN